jgi:hypothetical protein
VPTSKRCYECGNENLDQSFCGACGSPLTLNDYISTKVKNQLSDTLRDRDVLEMDSSIKVFKRAWEWIRLIIGIAVGLLVLTGVGVIWKASDFWSGVDKAKQSVTDTAKKSSDDITRSSFQSKQEIFNALKEGKAAIVTASSDAARQAKALKETTVQTKADILKQATSLHDDIKKTRLHLEAASKIQPEIEGMKNQLAQATKDIQAQQKALSSSEQFVKSVFSSHVTQYFSFKLNVGAVRTVDSKKCYVVIPPSTKDGKITVVLLLLDRTPIEGTLQLQQQVAVQPPGSYFNIHNLVVFYWGDPASNLETKPLSVSYFPDKSDTEIIHSLSEHDGRVFADDQPLPEFTK